MSTERTSPVSGLKPTEEMVLAGGDVLLAACSSPGGQLHPWKPFDVAQIAIKVWTAMEALRKPDHAQSLDLREALEFYADPTRYNGPNQRVEGEPDKFQPKNLYYRLDVSRDGGRIARRALAQGPDTSTVCTSGESK